ncbi:MAG TPA: hypothetical protein VGR29_01025 [Thermomicrobiales bacterium]|nr:hypothetical protein [Thermomicrobiales bacterium]
MTYRASRRQFIVGVLGISAAPATLPHGASAQIATPSNSNTHSAPEFVVSIGSRGENDLAFERAEFGIVGIYDGDWFEQPGFPHLLDNLAASPQAFHGVRYFGAFTAGQPEQFLPKTGGSVWTRADAPIDFSVTFDALEALTSRGLIPFISLGFFPPASSGSPVQPPREWDAYKRLVRTFFEELAADPRFGREAIAGWWFEAWNEPNEGRFWTGSIDEFFALYRATSEAIAETGLSVRFGGPAIAYKPQASPRDGAPWMERFLRFVASEPELQCDFISLHRKGTVGNDPPDPRRMYEAAVTTADQMLEIDPERFAGMVIINNEADEKVGFEHPYAPRLDEHNAAWLATVTTIHGGLAARYEDAGFRFIGAADNANLQLVEEPFDGRRSIMTQARDSETDLLKLPAYAFYELLSLLGDCIGTVVAGADQVVPRTDIYHLATFAERHAGCLITHYPDPGNSEQSPHTLEYVVTDIPWGRVNIARFQIDNELSNAHTAAGGSEDNPFPVPDPEGLGVIRQAQELAVARPIERDVSLDDGTYREPLEIAPYTTICLWITPFEATTPASPEWLSIEVQDGNVVLRWTPDGETNFYSYEVFLMTNDEPGPRLTPEPLRSALWVDTAPPHGSRSYGVRTVTASGMTSPIVASDAVTVR